VKSFNGKSGLRKEMAGGSEDIESIDLEFPSHDITEFLLGRFVRALRNEEFYVNRLHTDQLTYQVCKDDIMFVLIEDGTTLRINAAPEHQPLVRLMLTEELLSLSDLLDATQKMEDLQAMGSGLLAGMFC
jgi:hypothetical protein